MASPIPLGGYKTPSFKPTRFTADTPSPLSPAPTTPPPTDVPALAPTPDAELASLSIYDPDDQWLPVLSSPCHFPLSVFLATLKGLCLHPERNSSLILRAEPVGPAGLDAVKAAESADPEATEKGLEGEDEGKRLGLELVERVRLRLMPRQPKRDGRLYQTCLFYRSREDGHVKVGEGEGKEGEVKGTEMEKGGKEGGLVVLVPEVKEKGEVPYYHPPVRKIAFRWEEWDGEGDEDEDEEAINCKAADGAEEPEDKTGKVDGADEDKPEVRGRISIHYLPFPDAPASTAILTPSPTSAQPNALPVRGPKPRKRSPLAGPSIDQEPDEPIPPPAVILHDTLEVDQAPAGTGKGVLEKEKEKSDERLYRTCLALLERLYKHGYGQAVGYQKRKIHDVIVPRDNFQDLYLALKERHRHLDSRAPNPLSNNSKVEDVKRHVWKDVSQRENNEQSSPAINSPPSLISPDDPLLPMDNISDWGEQDVAIAAFLMLLWKEMYPARDLGEVKRDEMEEEREWDKWGRPEGGFVDLGCGNGLLVHILTSEGYYGKGYELRTRRTWPLYPPKTQDALVELPVDPASWFPETMDQWKSGSWPGKEACVVKEGTFLIGNHADELTPWIPLLSLIPSTPVPHLSLPCCLHTLDSAFVQLNYTAPPHPHTPAGGFEAGLEPGMSRYKSYLMWLGWVGLQCGWEWEKEGLRVPSTKGWGIVARKRWADGEGELEGCREWALGQVEEVRQRGAFKIREKEGKVH
ncbi:hypothetical protein IAT38_001052 [Cryptococcus sp. DSM 104549]